MSVYYPRGIAVLRVFLENKESTTPISLNDVHIFTVRCHSIEVNFNTYREADTFALSIDFKNFPFDPRAVRSCGVTIHFENLKNLKDENGNLFDIKPTLNNLIFQGYADEDRISLDDSSRKVHLKGRDFTSLLIDRNYTGKPIDISKPLDQAIQNLLNEIEETRLDKGRGIRVVNKTGGPLPVLSDAQSQKPQTKNSRRNRNYWDHIQDMVRQAGLIAYISLNELIITRPRELYNNENAKVFIYGENLNSLNFERKLGRQKKNNIRVLSWNVEKKEILEVRIPEDASDGFLKRLGLAKKRIQIDTIKTDGTKGTPKDAPFITFRVKEVKDVKTLRPIGERIFEEVGRQQIEGRILTNEMQTLDVYNNLFDITKIRIGTPIEIKLEGLDLEGVQKRSRPKAFREIQKFLVSKNFLPEIASAMALAISNFDTPFYTKSLKLTLDASSGFSADINFINFIELPRSLRP